MSVTCHDTERPGENIDREPNPTDSVPVDAGHAPADIADAGHAPPNKAYDAGHAPADIAYDAGHAPTDVYYTDLGTSTSTQVCWIQ